jgi:hypothetical protein
MVHGETEERISHEVVCIAGREFAGRRPEEFQLSAFGTGAMAR